MSMKHGAREAVIAVLDKSPATMRELIAITGYSESRVTVTVRHLVDEGRIEIAGTRKPPPKTRGRVPFVYRLAGQEQERNELRLDHLERRVAKIERAMQRNPRPEGVK